jgi:hypothetical protein
VVGVVGVSDMSGMISAIYALCGFEPDDYDVVGPLYLIDRQLEWDRETAAHDRSVRQTLAWRGDVAGGPTRVLVGGPDLSDPTHILDLEEPSGGKRADRGSKQ